MPAAAAFVPCLSLPSSHRRFTEYRCRHCWRKHIRVLQCTEITPKFRSKEQEGPLAGRTDGHTQIILTTYIHRPLHTHRHTHTTHTLPHVPPIHPLPCINPSHQLVRHSRVMVIIHSVKTIIINIIVISIAKRDILRHFIAIPLVLGVTASEFEEATERVLVGRWVGRCRWDNAASSGWCCWVGDNAVAVDVLSVWLQV